MSSIKHFNFFFLLLFPFVISAAPQSIPCGSPYKALNAVNSDPGLCYQSSRKVGSAYSKDPEFELSGCFPNLVCQIGETCYAHSSLGLLESALRRSGKLKDAEKIPFDHALSAHQKFMEHFELYQKSSFITQEEVDDLYKTRKEDEIYPERKNDYGFSDGIILETLNSGKVPVVGASLSELSTENLSYWTSKTGTAQSKKEFDAFIRLWNRSKYAPEMPKSLSSKAMKKFERRLAKWELDKNKYNKECQTRGRGIIGQALGFLCQGIPVGVRLNVATSITKEAEGYVKGDVSGGHFANIIGVVEDPRPAFKGKAAFKVADSLTPDLVSYISFEEACLIDRIDAVLVKGEYKYSEGFKSLKETGHILPFNQSDYEH